MAKAGNIAGKYKVGRGRPPQHSKFKKGKSGNEKGRAKGQRNYVTIYREAMIKIAKSQNITPEALEEILVQSGIKQALKGQFAFYKDNFDRLYGKPPQGIGTLDSDGEFKPQKNLVVLYGADDEDGDSLPS